jgi:hypothetical protein
MLLGQRAEGSERARAIMDRAAWGALLARCRSVAARALSHGEALEALLARPEMLEQFVASPRSWCNSE